MKKLWLYLFFISLTIHAQDVVDDDAALWLTANIEKEIGKSLSIHGGEQLRLNNNLVDLGQFTSNIGLQYKINKLIRVSGDYAFRQRRRLDASYSLRHQFFLSLFLRKRIKNFLFVYRNRIQWQFSDWLSSETGTTPQLYDRHKLSIRYELNKRFDTYISEEIYMPLKQNPNLGIDRNRLAIGLIYNVSKKMSVESFFLLQQRFSYNNPQRKDFIYGLTFSYQL
jgi:hypothetical protein